MYNFSYYDVRAFIKNKYPNATNINIQFRKGGGRNDKGILFATWKPGERGETCSWTNAMIDRKRKEKEILRKKLANKERCRWAYY